MISIVIPTFNRGELLKDTLEALANQSGNIDIEVIVVDSHSTDSTSSVVEQFKQNRLNLRHLNTSNIIAAKRNLGYASANSNFVIFLDDDCVPDHDLVSSYLQILLSASADTLAVFCGEVRYPESRVQKSNYYRFRDDAHFRPEDTSAPDLRFQNIVVMNMALNKSVIMEHLGNFLFDERFTGYGGEDVEFGWRLSQNKISILKATPKVIHFEPSRGIRGYAEKLFKNGRDGMNTLRQIAPNAIWSIASSKILEPSFPHATKLNAAMAMVARSCFRNPIAELIMRFLDATDSLSSFYSPFLYRYVLATSYINGVNQRSRDCVKPAPSKGLLPNSSIGAEETIRNKM
jgi:glycosyltransferase involved in cell wall biosynthesis